MFLRGTLPANTSQAPDVASEKPSTVGAHQSSPPPPSYQKSEAADTGKKPQLEPAIPEPARYWAHRP